jgi:hypothetical protein
MIVPSAQDGNVSAAKAQRLQQFGGMHIDRTAQDKVKTNAALAWKSECPRARQVAKVQKPAREAGVAQH